MKTAAVKAATARYQKAIDQAAKGNPDVWEMNTAMRELGKAHAALLEEMRLPLIARTVIAYADLASDSVPAVRRVAVALREATISQVRK